MADRGRQRRVASVSRRVMRGFSPDAFAALREDVGYAPATLARLAGVSRGTIANWESGKTSPSVDALARAMAVLRMPIEAVVQVKDDSKFPGDWRVLRGLTQPQLAVQVGVSIAYMGELERGEAQPNRTVAESWANVLGVDIDELIAAHVRVRQRPAGSAP